MEQNSIHQNFYEKIINSLFIKEKENSAKEELEDYIYNNKIEIDENNFEDFISNLLNSFKDEFFEEYRKKLEKDIRPIIIIESMIKIYSKNPYNFFILLNPLFDMYKNLEPKKISEYTNQIIKLLEDNNEIILKNFNELFEVVIYLIINQEQCVKTVGESLNSLLKKTLKNSMSKLDNKNTFDFDSFENKILEKTHINQPILDGFLLDWINEICKIEPFHIYMGKFFYDIIPWILKIKNNTIKDIANKAIDCDNEIKNLFSNKYLNYYCKESKQINKCILSFIKLIKNKNISEVSNEYNFLYELIKKFINIIEGKANKSSNNIYYDNSNSEFTSPVYKKRFSKLKYGDVDIKKRNIFSPYISSKRSRIFCEPNKNLSKSNNVNSFDFLREDSENANYELSEIIPLDTLNDFMKLIIDNNDITKEEQLNKLNSELKKLIEYIPNNYEKFNAKEFINTIIKGIEKPEILNKEYLLDWYQLLCEKYEEKISDESITAIINSILKTIQKQKRDKNPSMKFQNIIILMLQKLKKIDIEKIFSLIADSLNKINDYFFIYEIDGYLNNYLITNSRAEELMKSLSLYGKERMENNREFYIKMYKIFAYNPICLLIFCTITEYYELSWHLLKNLIKIKFEDDYYIYLSEFVQFMENTKSNHIRMLLLHPNLNLYLAKTLYGILMLLPQGNAYNILSNRLYSIKGLFKYTKKYNNVINKSVMEDIDYFIKIFLEVQKRKKEK